MTEQKQIPDLSGVLPLIDESYEQILLSIQGAAGKVNMAKEITLRCLPERREAVL